MSDVIIIVIIIVLVLVGIKGSMKHMRGEGGCCGGGTTVKPKKKKLDKVIHTYNFTIEGMHCQNCVNNVTMAINDIDGAAAEVNLNKKSAKVMCDRDIDIEIIKDKIESKGYKVEYIGEEKV